MTVLDTLIQSSTVALFHAGGVATAPLTPISIALEDFKPDYPVGLVALDGSFFKGSLALSAPSDIRAQLQRAGQRSADVRDLMRELTNQLVGRIKNRMTQYQVALSSNLPSSLDRDSERVRIGAKGVALTLYRFRTIRGQILVALQGSVDESRLVYTGTIRLNNEGDIILF